MKAIIKFFILFLVLNAGTWMAPQKASAQVSVNFQLFYDDLSPYGTWVDNSDYGYVWLPNVSAGFTPYGTNGYWVLTDAGWTWVSNYPWGWAPFHYGRWYSDPMYGYMWIPGNEWGPGWVTWRQSEGYYGWAPIGPGISIEFAYGSGYNLPYNQWTFVRGGDFGRTNINNYYINSSNNVTIINKSTVINNIQVDKSSKVKYNAGPNRTEVEKHVGKTITPVSIKESSKPGQNLGKDQLQIYRPQVQNNTSTGTKPAPSKVASLKDVKPAPKKSVEPAPQKTNQPVKQKPLHPQQTSPSKKMEGEKRPQQVTPKKNTGGEKQHQYKNEPPHQQSPQPQQTKPSQNTGGEKQPQYKSEPPHQKSPQLQPTNPPQNTGGGERKHPH